MTDGSQVPEHSRPYQYRTDNARLILIFLVITDLIFIALHALRWWFNSPNLALRIDMEGGYGEVFQYTKYLWAAILIGWFAAKNRAWRFASWSIVFLYFLADDCLAIHETLGALVPHASISHCRWDWSLWILGTLRRWFRPRPHSPF